MAYLPKKYTISRVAGPDGHVDPCAPLHFEPPKGSDELHDALKTAYPDLKTLQERMLQAVIDFHTDEQVILQRTLSTTSSFSDNSWSAMPSLSPDFSPAASFPTVESSPITPAMSSSEGQSWKEMTAVFSLSGNAVKTRKKRCMTSKEKKDYKQKRIEGACDLCRRRRKKCDHNSRQPEHRPQSMSASKAHPQTAQRTSRVALSTKIATETSSSTPEQSTDPSISHFDLAFDPIPMSMDFDLDLLGVDMNTNMDFFNGPDFDLFSSVSYPPPNNNDSFNYPQLSAQGSFSAAAGDVNFTTQASYSDWSTQQVPATLPQFVGYGQHASRGPELAVSARNLATSDHMPHYEAIANVDLSAQTQTPSSSPYATTSQSGSSPELNCYTPSSSGSQSSGTPIGRHLAFPGVLVNSPAADFSHEVSRTLSRITVTQNADESCGEERYMSLPADNGNMSRYIDYIVSDNELGIGGSQAQVSQSIPRNTGGLPSVISTAIVRPDRTQPSPASEVSSAPLLNISSSSSVTTLSMDSEVSSLPINAGHFVLSIQPQEFRTRSSISTEEFAQMSPRSRSRRSAQRFVQAMSTSHTATVRRAATFIDNVDGREDRSNAGPRFGLSSSLNHSYPATFSATVEPSKPDRPAALSPTSTSLSSNSLPIASTVVLPPENITPTFQPSAPASASTRRLKSSQKSTTANGTAELGSMTTFILSSTSLIAALIWLSVTLNTALTLVGSLITLHGQTPTGVRKPSAIVSVLTLSILRPWAKPLLASSAPSKLGSAPKTYVPVPKSAVATPDNIPPPPHGAMTASSRSLLTSGLPRWFSVFKRSLTCSSSSRAMVPCPRIMSG